MWAPAGSVWETTWLAVWRKGAEPNSKELEKMILKMAGPASPPHTALPSMLPGYRQPRQPAADSWALGQQGQRGKKTILVSFFFLNLTVVHFL